MNLERARSLLLSLPDTHETMPFTEMLVIWVGEKAIGGKMCAMFPLHPQRFTVSYPAGQLRYDSLLEIEGLAPAPYLAKNFWVAAERWDVFRDPDWQTELRAGYDYIRARLAPKTLQTLALPAAQQARILKERKAILSAAEAKKKAAIESKPKT